VTLRTAVERDWPAMFSCLPILEALMRLRLNKGQANAA
jgi:hypothetical protein